MVVLFTFIPALIFVGVFYRKTYKERISYHIAENEKYMLTKLEVLEDDLLHKGKIIENLSKSIGRLSEQSGKTREAVFEGFLKRNPDFKAIRIVSDEEMCRLFNLNQVEKSTSAIETIHYYLGSENVLFMSYPIRVEAGLQEALVSSISIKKIVNWFTRIATSTYITVVSDGVIVYNSAPFDKEENKLQILDDVSESISLLKIGDENKNFYGLKREIPVYNMTIYIFREDDSIEVFRSFYFDYVIKILVMVLLSALVTFVISLKINYPFNTIKKAAEAIINGDYDARIENVQDEILSLNLSFNKIALLHQEKNEEFVQYAMTMLEKNEKLAELNDQLEASYDQLKAITEMLEYSKNKYKALFDHIKEFIWVFDQNGFLTYANLVMCDKLGYTEEEIIGLHFTDIFLRFDEEELIPLDELTDQLMRRDYNNLSIWLKQKNNEELLVSANSKRLFKNGLLQGAQGTARTVEFEEMLQNRVLRKNREFEIVKEITWSLANNRTMESLLTKVVQKVEELFVPELCTIRIVEGAQLIFKTGTGRLVEFARTDDFLIDEDFSGMAIRDNKVVRIKDFENTIIYNRSSLETLLENVKEIIVIPLENKGEIHGTINIGLSEPLKDVDVKILKALANQASIGIGKVKLYDQLKEDYLNTIRVLATAVEAKDKYTEGHSYRVSMLAKRIGHQLCLSDEAVEELEIAGMLHDIGKIGIGDEILTKNGELTDNEYNSMKLHPAVGKKILEPIGLSDNIINGVYLHHKRFDLKGYPEDAAIESLNLYPSVIGVADAFDAMTSNRTYSSEKSLEVAMAEIIRYKGKQFCPRVVEALVAIVREDLESIMEIIR